MSRVAIPMLRIGWRWKREHARLDVEVLEQLDVRAGHRVVEIGSGPGEPRSEDRVFSVHSIYFWPDVDGMPVYFVTATRA